MRFELRYSDGGHGGPVGSALVDALAAAERYARGLTPPRESYTVTIYPEGSEQWVGRVELNHGECKWFLHESAFVQATDSLKA